VGGAVDVMFAPGGGGGGGSGEDRSGNITKRRNERRQIEHRTTFADCYWCSVNTP